MPAKMHNRIQTSLNFSSVDFDNIDEVNRLAGNLINFVNSFGVINGTSTFKSKEAEAIYQAAKDWVNTVKNRLFSMPPSDALRVIDSYEIMYRIANRTSVKPVEIDNVKLAAFDAMIRGDKDVDEYIMFRLIRNAVRQRENVFLGRPLKWSCLKEEQWHKEATAGFDLEKLSDYDIISIASILLDSDLYAFEGSRQLDFKRQIFYNTRHYLDNYDATDPKIQIVLERYLYASAGFLSESEFERYTKSVKYENLDPLRVL